MRFFAPLILLLSLALASCHSSLPLPAVPSNQFENPACDLCHYMATGHLIFVRDTAGMGSAIAASTGQYTHVAIAQCTDSGLFVIEALPQLGVVRRPFESFGADILDSDSCFLCVVDFYALNIPFDTARFIARVNSLLGQPYDDYFMPDNGRIYCSELVYECFLDSAGNHLFSAAPMNFLDSAGRLPRYWQQHFDNLGFLVPQGVPGTNPTAMSQSPFLLRTKYQ